MRSGTADWVKGRGRRTPAKTNRGKGEQRPRRANKTVVNAVPLAAPAGTQHSRQGTRHYSAVIAAHTPTLPITRPDSLR